MKWSVGMIYNDGVNMDEEGKVLECPRCNNEEFSQDAEHCRICGLSTSNKCEGYYDEEYGGHFVSHDNPSNARFCETCGKPTAFFNEEILKPWEIAKQELETEDEVAVSLDDDLPF